MDLSIIIPTFNRYSFLEKAIKYYSISNCKATIVIVDSSVGREKNNNKSLIKKYKNLKIEYFNRKGKPHTAIKKIKKKIKTKFLVFTGDDDFLLSENLKYHFDFLQNNKAYIAVNGRAYLLRHFKETFTLSDYPLATLNQNTAYKRCKYLLENYAVPFFSICRTSFFFNSLDYINKKKYPHENFNDELVLSTILASNGKIFSSDKNYLVRHVGHTKRGNFTNFRLRNKMLISINSMIEDLRLKITKVDGYISSENLNYLRKVLVWKFIERKYNLKLNKKENRIFYLKRYLNNFRSSKAFFYFKKFFLFNQFGISRYHFYFLRNEEIQKSSLIKNDIKIFFKSLNNNKMY